MRPTPIPAVLAALLCAQGAPVLAQTAPSFERDVAPIFERHCVGCHGWWFPKGSLRLDSREAVLEGGRSGPAVVPGEPEKGWIVRLVDPAMPPEKRMPPEAEPLGAEEIARIKRWIRAGAP